MGRVHNEAKFCIRIISKRFTFQVCFLLVLFLFYSFLIIVALICESGIIRPEQIHIAYGDDPISMITVTWSTTKPAGLPAVRYGRARMTNVATGVSSEFLSSGKRVQYVHRVYVRNLIPGISYVYVCGSTLGWSKKFSFRTADNSTHWSPTVAVYGDMGATDSRILPYLRRDVENNLIDAVFHLGDIAYDMNDNEGRVGDHFMRLVEPVAANTPYMVSPGNHERTDNFSQYINRFSMPGTKNNMYYSFRLGCATVISINTEVYYLDNESLVKEQYSWLVEELKSAHSVESRKVRPWVIVYGHRPMYCTCSGKDCSTGIARPVKTRLGLEKLFYKKGVDLALWGDEHIYERLLPVFDNLVMNGSKDKPYTNPKAAVHVISGAAGSRHGLDTLESVRPKWSAAIAAEHSYTKLHITNMTHINLKQISADRGGRVIDEVWIIKNNQ